MLTNDFNNELSRKFEKEYDKIIRQTPRPNILLIGGTGVGKSSLVNRIFGQQLAETGAGRPVTKHVKPYECADIPIKIYDTMGYEVDADVSPGALEDVIAFATGRDKNVTSERVHLVWYVIDASKGRILDMDLEVCRRLKKEKIPIAAVITKCDLATEEEVRALHDLLHPVLGNAIFAVTIHDLPDSLGTLDLESLCEWSAENLPEFLQFAFLKAQRVNLALKREKAIEVILQHTTGNALVGFIPIPFSDAPILLTSQAGMIVRILYIYDLQNVLAAVSSIYASLLGSMVAKLGIWLASSLLKLIPIYGQIVGGTINAVVAASITGAMGAAVIKLSERTHLLVLEGREEELKELLDNVEGALSRNLQEALDHTESLTKPVTQESLEKLFEKTEASQ